MVLKSLTDLHRVVLLSVCVCVCACVLHGLKTHSFHRLSRRGTWWSQGWDAPAK